MAANQRRNRFWVRSERIGGSDPGVWATALVSVFEGEIQIGTYERNLAGWAETTFGPFEWDGKWYALYSPDYTTTRVMSLPDCQDIGGEDPSPGGFCPVEFFVPRYRERTTRDRTRGQSYSGWEFSNAEISPAEALYETTYAPWVTVSTGFIAGCRWGDDSTWKLECVDLALAVTGHVVRTARFGHVELAQGNTLAASLRFDRNLPHWDLRMTLTRQERRDVATGALIDPFDE